MRVWRVSMLGLVSAASLTGCESVTGVLVNGTGSHVEIAVIGKDGRIAHGALEADQRLVLRRPLTELDRIEYRYGANSCQLSGDDLLASPLPRWNETRHADLKGCGTEGERK